MTNEQINMAAQEYADQHFIERVATGAPLPESKKAYAKAFADGADFALKHQWIRTLDQMPEDGELVIVLAHGTGLCLARWNEKFQCWDDADGDDIMVGADDVEEWCPIPD